MAKSHVDNAKDAETVAKYFDEIVIKYNEWLMDIQEPIIQGKTGFVSFLKTVGHIDRHSPLYIFKNAVPEQYAAVERGSDWLREECDLDKIISGFKTDEDMTKKDAIEIKQYVHDCYAYFRNLFVTYTLM
jgi:hypothetical protein